ncbi:MAG: hypothetical protein WBG71_11970 [Leeuwenhoekiella sp.]
MKTSPLYFLLTFVFFSCSENESQLQQTGAGSPLFGKWHLSQQLSDPGDGSGTFQPIDSDKTLTLKPNGVVEAENVSLCHPYDDQLKWAGKLNLEDSTISTTCDNPNIAKIFVSMEGGSLRLDYVSNEGFSQLYTKVEE